MSTGLISVTNTWRGIAALAVVLSSLSLAKGHAPESTPEALTIGQLDQVEAVVRQLVSNNPNLVVDALRLAQEQIAEQRLQASLSVVTSQAAALYDDEDAPTLGADSPQVTIVEFLDYQCGFCKQAHPDLDALLAAHPDVQLVTKQIPILGPASLYAARAAMAADRLGQFPAFHNALMSARVRLSEDIVMQIAERSGIDPTALAAEMAVADTDTQAAFSRNRELAQALGITGTPAFVIGDQILRGLPNFASLGQLVSRQRENAD